LDVRYWHLADIGLRGLNVCFGGKADIVIDPYPESFDRGIGHRLARLTNDPIPSFAIRNKITNFSLGAISLRLKDTPTAVIFSSNGVRRFKIIVGHITEYAPFGVVYKTLCPS
jgi:hypothetical protein